LKRAGNGEFIKQGNLLQPKDVINILVIVFINLGTIGASFSNKETRFCDSYPCYRIFLFVINLRKKCEFPIVIIGNKNIDSIVNENEGWLKLFISKYSNWFPFTCVPLTNNHSVINGKQQWERI